MDTITQQHADELISDIFRAVDPESVDNRMVGKVFDFLNAVCKSLDSEIEGSKERISSSEGRLDTAEASISTLNSSVAVLVTRLNTLVSGNASEAIDSFNEIEAFLTGLKDSDRLVDKLAELRTLIGGNAGDIAGLKNKVDEHAGLIAEQGQEIGSISSKLTASVESQVFRVFAGVYNSRTEALQNWEDGSVYFVKGEYAFLRCERDNTKENPFVLVDAGDGYNHRVDLGMVGIPNYRTGLTARTGWYVLKSSMPLVYYRVTDPAGSNRVEIERISDEIPTILVTFYPEDGSSLVNEDDVNTLYRYLNPSSGARQTAVVNVILNSSRNVSGEPRITQLFAGPVLFGYSVAEDGMSSVASAVKFHDNDNPLLLSKVDIEFDEEGALNSFSLEREEIDLGYQGQIDGLYESFNFQEQSIEELYYLHSSLEEDYIDTSDKVRNIEEDIKDLKNPIEELWLELEEDVVGGDIRGIIPIDCDIREFMGGKNHGDFILRLRYPNRIAGSSTLVEFFNGPVTLVKESVNTWAIRNLSINHKGCLYGAEIIFNVSDGGECSGIFNAYSRSLLTQEIDLGSLSQPYVWEYGPHQEIFYDGTVRIGDVIQINVDETQYCCTLCKEVTINELSDNQWRYLKYLVGKVMVNVPGSSYPMWTAIGYCPETHYFKVIREDFMVPMKYLINLNIDQGDGHHVDLEHTEVIFVNEPSDLGIYCAPSFARAFFDKETYPLQLIISSDNDNMNDVLRYQEYGITKGLIDEDSENVIIPNTVYYTQLGVFAFHGYCNYDSISMGLYHQDSRGVTQSRLIDI